LGTELRGEDEAVLALQCARRLLLSLLAPLVIRLTLYELYFAYRWE